ncbi:GrpB family protein [Duncaniella muris]|uniref:GrpB family protein n=1 Tax=Duncaniella muris TaxID=2094150 RepID=UPI003F677987
MDILVEISPDIEWQSLKDILEHNGYICMSESETRISFNKGYTPADMPTGCFMSTFIRTGDNEEILFRDYLIANPESAEEYEKLKLLYCQSIRVTETIY